MLSSITNSVAAFRLLLALPAIIMLGRVASSGGGSGLVLQASGEWAVRFLIMALAVTPVRMLFRGQHWPMWWFKRRRDIGTAAALYAIVHLAAYVVRQSNINVILYDLQYPEYFLGWAALAGMMLLVVTSNDFAVHHMGLWWKRLQRIVYLCAVAAFLHWIWIKLDNVPAYIHFAPLAALEAWRVWYNFTKPGRRHAQE